jgi:uncharacterized protein (DUF433 family)
MRVKTVFGIHSFAPSKNDLKSSQNVRKISFGSISNQRFDFRGSLFMARTLKRITVNPEICMGQPTIRGMRITVAFVLKLMASGMGHDEILAAYPELEKADLRQAIEFGAWLASDYHRPLKIVTG